MCVDFQTWTAWKTCTSRPTVSLRLVIDMSLAPGTFPKEQEAGHELVDRTYNINDVLGDTAAARASHHEFQFGRGVMSVLPSCTTGAKADIFPGSASPLALLLHKRQLASNTKQPHCAGMSVANTIDAHVLARRKKLYLEADHRMKYRSSFGEFAVNT